MILSLRVRRLLGYGIAAGAFIFALRQLDIRMHDLLDAMNRIGWMQVGIATLLLGCHIWVNSQAFGVLSRGLGASVDQAQLALAWRASLLSKYLPGGIWHVVGRGLILNRLKVPGRITLWGGILEQGYSLLACLVFAVTFLVANRLGHYWAVVALVTGGLSFALAAAMGTGQSATRMSKRHLVAAAMYALAMIPFALAHICLLTTAPDTRILFALFGGTIAGVMVVLAPGGLGVRESVAAILAPHSDGTFLAALVMGRILLLLLDALFSFIGQVALRRGETLL